MAVVNTRLYHLRPTVFLSIFIFTVNSPMMTYSITEGEALLKLKSSFTNTAALNTWVPRSEPCGTRNRWQGVICSKGFVTGLRLEGLSLSGKLDVDALLQIKGLRTISIARNLFSGPIPDLNRIGFLKAMYLSGNQFSGEIPPDYFAKMGSLKKIWLPENKFTGTIPSSLAQIPNLLELYLQNNQFGGSIPNIETPSLSACNISNNKLQGQIPIALLRLDPSSFSGNPSLCGEKVGKECSVLKADKVPVINNDKSSPNSTRNKPAIAGGIASAVFISVVIFVLVRTRRKQKEFDALAVYSRNSVNNEGSVQVQVSEPLKREADSVVRRGNSSRRRTGFGADLVIVNDEKGVFGLSDLMKAAAEVLGNGGLGSSYKAVMANGVAVVVKRMRDMNALGKEEFEKEIRQLGKLRHWNILTPLAFHFRKDEKLVVSEYVPQGSLLYLLHGDRGPSNAELDWPARLKIVHGIAKGLEYLHTELASNEVPHGNIKSSNILIGRNYEPMLSDFGFSSLICSPHRTHALFAYKAPEALENAQVTPKCDVYCLGIVILEILTGKFPSQYLSNGKGGIDAVEWVVSAISEGREFDVFDPQIANVKNSLGEMKQLLHVGAACTRNDPEERLDLQEAIRRIEAIMIKYTQESTRRMHVSPTLGDGIAQYTPQNHTTGDHIEQYRWRQELDSN